MSEVRKGDIRQMELNRRNMLYVLFIGALTGAFGFVRSFGQQARRRVQRAVRPSTYPGTVEPLDEKKLKKKGKWLG